MSEIYMTAEANGLLSQPAYSSKPENRRACNCRDNHTTGISSFISNRADEAVNYGSIAEALKESGLTIRKPDRVYGLQKTKGRFTGILNSPATGILNDEATQSVEEFLETSPFEPSDAPLLFPFLICEAKSEKGQGFRACGIQSALPLIRFLDIQGGLENLTSPLDEQGGPLVWYLVYRGDSWRVSGSYFVISEGEQRCVSQSLKHTTYY
jgi:hypothetical protein